MKRPFLIFLLCATVLGCQRSMFDRDAPDSISGLELTTSEVGYEPWFTAGEDLLRAPIGKVTEVNFQALDTIGVFLYSGALGGGPYHSTNMIYYTADGTPDGSTSPKWTAATAMGGALVAGTSYYSTAYYPYQEGGVNASALVHSVAADQRAAAVVGSATALERSDLMWAPPVSVSNPATAPAAVLAFRHVLTKLVVSLQVPSTIDGVAVSKLNSVAIKNLATTASVHLGTGALSNLSNKKDIKPRQLSGTGNPGTVSVYEAIVVPQTAASGVVLVEVKCQTASGEKTAHYFPAASGLVLGGGKKITLTLTSAADIAITSELDLVTGQAYTDLPLRVKVATGTAWTLAAPAGSWITLATSAGGAYGDKVTNTGTGADQTVFVKTTANTGAGATPRQAVLTLSGTVSGVARSVTYTAVQNYSQPVVGFPVSSVVMEGESYQLPAVSGNSNWTIKCSNMSTGMRLSRRNVAYDQLTAADTIALHSLTTTLPKEGYMVSGNYYNSNGVLYVVTDMSMSPNVANFTCNGVAVTIDARSIKVAGIRWARGNLVASGARGAAGVGGCRVGNPADGGLYFQFGGLIGFKGGNQDNGGTGVGIPKGNLVADPSKPAYWDGVGYSWASDAMVWPTGMVGTKVKWEATAGVNISLLTDYYFNYSVIPWETLGQNIRDFAVLPGTGTGTLGTGRYAALGVGDPCSYYLGSTWRLPTAEDYSTLCVGKSGAENANYPWAEIGGAWTGTPVNGGKFFGKADLSGKSCFFPASGYRYLSSGAFYYVTWYGYGWSSSVHSAYYGLDLYFYGSVVYPQSINHRSYGFPVRCVSSAP